MDKTRSAAPSTVNTWRLVPISLSRAAIEANRQGLELRASGRFLEAAAAFARGVQAQPDVPELQLNLAVALTHAGRLDEARDAYARVLQLRPSDVSAHWAMYELEQMRGNLREALAHQNAALAQQSTFSVYAPAEKRRVIALMAPGDWQANVPVDYLIDTRETTLHKVYVTSEQQSAALTLPRADVILTAIANSPHSVEHLRWAASIVQRSGLPCINAPQLIERADRRYVFSALRTVHDVRVPETQIVQRSAIAGSVQFPAVVRPLDSQAGRDLALLRSLDELDAYLNRTEAGAFYVMPFVDYSNPDGYFRKYRLFVVDGTPYPCHLAISKHWMIHYYNAPMREHQWMRDEERVFIEHFNDVFDRRLRTAMSAVAERLGLEYLGLDCTIDPDGSLLIFEADPAMIVHAADEPEKFAYKHSAARDIFAAFASLCDDARSR